MGVEPVCWAARQHYFRRWGPRLGVSEILGRGWGPPEGQHSQRREPGARGKPET
jgi:hypothetical protein